MKNQNKKLNFMTTVKQLIIMYWNERNVVIHKGYSDQEFQPVF